MSYVIIDHHSVYRALEREQVVNDKLRENLDSERRSQLEITDRENSIFEDMQLELDSERAKINDLKNSMEREKQRLQSQVTALETQTSALKDELERERLTCRQMKNEIDQIQVNPIASLFTFFTQCFANFSTFLSVSQNPHPVSIKKKGQKPSLVFFRVVTHLCFCFRMF